MRPREKKGIENLRARGKKFGSVGEKELDDGRET